MRLFSGVFFVPERILENHILDPWCTPGKLGVFSKIRTVSACAKVTDLPRFWPPGTKSGPRGHFRPPARNCPFLAILEPFGVIFGGVFCPNFVPRNTIFVPRGPRIYTPEKRGVFSNIRTVSTYF